MAAINKHAPVVHTFEGGVASKVSAKEELRRAVLTCLLWEDTFYEPGQLLAARIAQLVPQVPPAYVADLAVEARERFHLRHAPLFLVRELARHSKLSKDVGFQVRYTLTQIIQRADELAEFMALYWKDGRCPIAASVKKGLAQAFTKFNEYNLAKYNRLDKAVKLRDVLFMVHAKPANPRGTGERIQPLRALDKPKYKRGPVRRHLEGQGEMWSRLVTNQLATPDTWEVSLSAGADKKETFERLLKAGKLGGLAVLRNLRNMEGAGVPRDLIRERLLSGCGKALPFRFVTAARYAPQLEDAIEQAMMRSLADLPTLPGRTGLLIDVSGSMDSPLSAKGETTRLDAANGLAILLREKAEFVDVAAFSDNVVLVPPRRGFALRDAVHGSQQHRGTYLAGALKQLQQHKDWNHLDRLIVITDEQSQDGIIGAWLPKSYLINVAAYQNGVGYDRGWNHISGWSERVVDYIREMEVEAAE